MLRSAQPNLDNFDNPAKNVFRLRVKERRVLAYQPSPEVANDETSAKSAEHWLCAENTQMYADNFEVKKIPLAYTLTGLSVACAMFWALVALAVFH